jgi:type IV secretion system protein VirB4
MLSRKAARTEPDRVGDVLLWSHMVSAPLPTAAGPPTAPTVIQNKDGALMAVLRYRGPDVAMLDYTQWCLYLQGWNLLAKRLGEGWALWPDEWHEPARAYPQSTWRNPAGYFLDSIRKTVFEQGQLFETDQFLTLAWQPPSTSTQYWYDSIFVQRAHQRRQSEDEAQVHQYIGALEKVIDALSHLVPEATWCSPKETLTYLRRCVSWDRHMIGLPERPEHLDLTLGSTRYQPGFTPRLGHRYLRPISIRNWPGALGMTVPTTLQQLDIPYRFTVRYICLDTAKAKRILHGMRRRWEVQVLPISVHIADAWNGTRTDWRDENVPVNEEARENVYALQRAISSLSNDEYGYGYCSPTILVWGDTRQEVAARERAVIKLLQQDEFTVEPEVENADDAWQGTHPGNAYKNVRNPPFSTRTFAFLMPHGSIWAGQPWDHHWYGPALLTASSQGHPFWYSLHQGEVGGTMILGPTRSGKSGLLALMGMQALRYKDMQIFAWDRDFSLYCATMMAGGAHYQIGDRGRGLQPLGKLETEAEVRWRHEWLTDLFKAEGVPPDVQERKAMWDALLHLARQPRRARTLTLYGRYLQVHHLKQALEPYCLGGRFECFDAEEDSFRLGAEWTTFEMGTMMEMAQHACALGLQYMLHEVERCFTGRPTLLLLDEAWQVATHETFWPKVFLYLKAKAKQNVSVVLSSQEVVDMRESALWQALQGSIRTWIYLPNRQAMNEDVLKHYKACGLSEAHTQLLAMAQNYRDYLIKAGENVRLMQCAFDALQRCFIAASKPEEIYELQTLAASQLSEPLQAAWLRANGFAEAADTWLAEIAA